MFQNLPVDTFNIDATIKRISAIRGMVSDAFLIMPFKYILINTIFICSCLDEIKGERIFLNY